MFPTLIRIFPLLALTSRPAFTAIATDYEAVLKLKTDLYEGGEGAMNAVEKEAFKESEEDDESKGVLIPAKSRSRWIKTRCFPRRRNRNQPRFSLLRYPPRLPNGPFALV